MPLELIKKWATCGGELRRYRHESTSTRTPMVFAVFVPPSPKGTPAPILLWLSGLTCTDENFSQKAGAAFPVASELGIALVLPDTSPRGASVEGIPGSKDSWDFGLGAGFYVDATQAPWSEHWNMGTYISNELPALLKAELSGELDVARISISGHSMGGYGALQTALRHPGTYKSVSAFSPISHPSACPWGKKAFTNYLGSDEEGWKAWDPTFLIKAYTGPPLNLRIDCGAADEFYINGQLLPEDLVKAAPEGSIEFNLHPAYDHSYFFVNSFISAHIRHHAKFLL